MMRDIPVWFIIGAVIVLVIGIASMAFTVDRCGWKGLLFGNSAVIVAATVCDGE